MTAREWAEQIVFGGQLSDFTQVHEDPRVAGVLWAINCLTNPDCEGSDQVITAIQLGRDELMRAGRPRNCANPRHGAHCCGKDEN